MFVSISVTSQIDRIEPPNWWVGFKETKLQLLVKGKEISAYSPEIEYDGVSIQKVHKAKSPNYLFIDLQIDSDTKPGSLNIVFDAKGKKKIKYQYELRSRIKSADEFQGFNSSDVIYLITPDRFANSIPDNDIVAGLKEKAINRQEDYATNVSAMSGIIFLTVYGFFF